MVEETTGKIGVPDIIQGTYVHPDLINSIAFFQSNCFERVDNQKILL